MYGKEGKISMRVGSGLFLSLVLGLAPGPLLAWSDHASLVWPLVRGLPDLREPRLPVESLADFVAAEAPRLEALLAEHEELSRRDFEHYAPRPEALAFRTDASDLRGAFLQALRVNPTLAYLPYRQVMVEDPAPEQDLDWSRLSFLAVGSSHVRVRYEPLEPGSLVSPAHVLASASDEPDFGMDIGLFADNGTDYGRRYGFANQPFGNPNLEYSSQAPFHMGFYHLDFLTRTLQPDLLRTYPAWRVSLFGTLADFAFETGHPYWGWRFAGWALHYIGDLSQPYHAQPLPGIGTLQALWLVASGRADEAVQLVSNRHGVIESYQHQRVLALLQAQAWESELLRAVAVPERVPAWNERTLVDELSRRSVQAGEALDAALEAHVPARFVSDPAFEWTGSGEENALVETLRATEGERALTALDAILSEQLTRFSRFAAAWITRFNGSPDVP
jgi:hypothetical protein